MLTDYGKKTKSHEPKESNEILMVSLQFFFLIILRLLFDY